MPTQPPLRPTAPSPAAPAPTGPARPADTAEATAAPAAAAASGPSDAAGTGGSSGAADASAPAGAAGRSGAAGAPATSEAARGDGTPDALFAPGTGPSANPAPGHHRTVRSFVPRRSRVTEAQRQALLRRWPEWGVEIDGHSRLNLGELFAGRPVVLEIGFGMGEATAEMAAADPDTGVLAVDVHTPGQGNLLRLAEQRGLENVRVGNGDALLLLERMLTGRCLAGVRVYFPDPWPKKRHHKRRLVQPAFVELCASRMAPGAVLHCATDWEPYAQHMLEVLTASPSFENTAPGFAPRPAFRPLTRFEQQGLAKGHTVHDLLFRRLP